MHGIELMQEKKIYISDDSPNIIREFGEYQWKENKDGTFINSPRQENCHAIDAIRYVLNQPKPKDFGFH
jgi:phage terminase large subunit